MVWALKESKPNVGHPQKVLDKMHQRQPVVKQHRSALIDLMTLS